MFVKRKLVVEWLTHQTSNLKIARCTGSNPVRGMNKKLYTNCSELVGSRKGFKYISIGL